jgi:tetratricopeptide (TPR) repeat protein
VEHLNAGRTVEALAITSKLILQDPTSLETLEKHAIVLLAEATRVEQIGETNLAKIRREEALETYIAACNVPNVGGLTQLSAAQLAHMLEEIPLAQSLYKKAHVAIPNDGRSALWLAQIELLNKHWEEASHWIEESLARQPNEPSALISAGLIQAQLGNCEQSLMYAKRAVEIRPKDEQVRFMQARILRLCNNPHRALEILSALSFAKDQIVAQEIGLCKATLEDLNR